MPFRNQAGIGVSQNYGRRDTGNSVGLEKGYNSTFVLSVTLTGASLNDGFVPPVVVPRGAQFKSATLRVDEAFVLGGTSPTVRVGANGATGTNNITLTQAELQAVGTKTVASTGNGTWAFSSATGTTSATRVAVDMGGTSPTATQAGKAVLVLEYFNKSKA